MNKNKEEHITLDSKFPFKKYKTNSLDPNDEKNWCWLEIKFGKIIKYNSKKNFNILEEFENIKNISDIKSISQNSEFHKLLEKNYVPNPSLKFFPNLVIFYRNDIDGNKISWFQDNSGRIFVDYQNENLYVAENLPEFLSHLLDDNRLMEDNKNKKEEDKRWICEFCQNELSTKFRLQEHTKKCNVKQYFDENENVKLFLLDEKLQDDFMKQCFRNPKMLEKIKSSNFSIDFHNKIIQYFYENNATFNLIDMQELGYNVKDYLKKYETEIQNKLLHWHQKNYDKLSQSYIDEYKRLGFELKVSANSDLVFLRENNFEFDKNKNNPIIVPYKNKIDKKYLFVYFYFELSENYDNLKDFNLIYSQYNQTYNFGVCNLTYTDRLLHNYNFLADTIYIFSKDDSYDNYNLFETVDISKNNFKEELKNWLTLFQFRE